MVKILFRHDAFEGVGIEGIWTKREGEYYVIDSIPFYVKNYALGDVISVVAEGRDLYVESLINESGNSVVRILFSSENKVAEVREQLTKMGCASELSNLPNLVSVDIPRTVSFKEIISFLENGEKLGDWEYQEACISNFHKQQSESA